MDVVAILFVWFLIEFKYYQKYCRILVIALNFKLICIIYVNLADWKMFTIKEDFKNWDKDLFLFETFFNLVRHVVSVGYV